MKRVLVLGDLHCDWKALKLAIHKTNPGIILQCGDFGVWPGLTAYHKLSVEFPDGLPVPLYFCDGNHENLPYLNRLLDDRCKPEIVQDENGKEKIIDNSWRVLVPFELPNMRNVYYCPRYSVIEYCGKRIMFIGGAESIDKNLRTPGVDWFPEETLRPNKFSKQFNGLVDIIVSHTGPASFLEGISNKNLTFADKTSKVLDSMLRVFSPKKWFFGHWHEFMRGRLGITDFMALGHSGCSDSEFMQYFDMEEIDVDEQIRIYKFFTQYVSD